MAEEASSGGAADDPRTNVEKQDEGGGLADVAVMPFARTLGIEQVEASPTLVHLRLQWAERLCTTGGALHGGVLMALADSGGGLCALLNLPEGSAGTTTIESKTNFLRAATSGAVDAVSKPLRAGRTVIVVETELRDQEGRLLAKATQSQLVLGQR